jgi:hypothetical protein
MRNGKKVLVTRKIEQILNQYKSFYDHDWAAKLTDTAPAELEDAVDSLCLAWKEAANTHAQPWLMMMQMESFAHSVLKKKQPEVAKLMKEVNAWLQANLKFAFNRDKMKELEKLAKDFERGLRIAEDKKDTRYPIDEHWNMLLGIGEIQISISGSQGLSYCGVVFAYEWFLVSSYRVLGGLEKNRPNQDRFWEDWKVRFGRDGEADYWLDTAVATARETRNCIAHTGGKVKPELKAMNPSYFTSKQGVLSIQPTDNHDLFKLLKGKVDSLVAEVAKKLAEREPLGK